MRIKHATRKSGLIQQKASVLLSHDGEMMYSFTYSVQKAGLKGLAEDQLVNFELARSRRAPNGRAQFSLIKIKLQFNKPYISFYRLELAALHMNSGKLWCLLVNS